MSGRLDPILVLETRADDVLGRCADRFANEPIRREREGERLNTPATATPELAAIEPLIVGITDPSDRSRIANDSVGQAGSRNDAQREATANRDRTTDVDAYFALPQTGIEKHDREERTLGHDNDQFDELLDVLAGDVAAAMFV